MTNVTRNKSSVNYCCCYHGHRCTCLKR